MPAGESLIPVIKTEDPRYTVRGQVGGPIGNMRMRITLTENPGFNIDLQGKEAAAAAANIIRDGLVRNFKRGLDAEGDPLPQLLLQTVARRERRQRQAFVGSLAVRAFKEAKGKKRKAKVAHQHADTIGGYMANLHERFRLRGRAPSGKHQYPGPIDMITPFHESGLIAENVVVAWKGWSERKQVGSGDPEFLIAWPTGGQTRGLHRDDGKGARLFAVRHYGFERMAGIPRNCERKLDQMLDNYLSRLLLVGRAPLRVLSQTVEILEHASAAIDDAQED